MSHDSGEGREVPPAFRHLQHELPEAELARRMALRLYPRRHEREARALAQRYRTVLELDGCLFFAGCGGFAAHAQHIAAELVVRYQKNRQALRALALGCNPAVVSAASNDLGAYAALARELQALGRKGDNLTLYSTSGRSPALLALALTAEGLGVATVALCPDGSPLAANVKFSLPVSDQLEALALDHIVAEELERPLPERLNNAL